MFSMIYNLSDSRVSFDKFIPKCLSNLIDLMLSILTNDSVTQCCPIAHCIPWDPSTIAYLNSSPHAASRYSIDLQLLWHLQWPGHIQANAATACTGDTFSIKALEYTTIIINHISTTAVIFAAPHDNDLFLTALFFTNNVASKEWIHKGAKQSPAGKALGSLLCAVMINNPVGINADLISPTNNIVADCISWFPNHNNPLSIFLPNHRTFHSCSNAGASTQVQS